MVLSGVEPEQASGRPPACVDECISTCERHVFGSSLDARQHCVLFSRSSLIHTSAYMIY